jgi:ribosome assembly protein YihI (activator of Der GTPase)
MIAENSWKMKLILERWDSSVWMIKLLERLKKLKKIVKEDQAIKTQCLMKLKNLMMKI